MNKVKNILFKNGLIAILFLFLNSCNSSSVSDCFQAAGDSVTMNVEVPFFSKVRTEGEVTLFIQQGEVQEVSVTTGENLLSDVTIRVLDDTLVLTDTNACNFVRDYGSTVVTITTPNLTEIRNASNYDIRGINRLIFPDLRLVSNTSGGLESPKKTGDFYLDIVTENLKVNANGQSVFFITGSAAFMDIRFTDENPRFEGRYLLVNDLKILQRSSNKMILHPLDKITGRILSTGDVIAVNRPSIIDVEEVFTGKLIFE